MPGAGGGGSTALSTCRPSRQLQQSLVCISRSAPLSAPKLFQLASTRSPQGAAGVRGRGLGFLLLAQRKGEALVGCLPACLAAATNDALLINRLRSCLCKWREAMVWARVLHVSISGQFGRAAGPCASTCRPRRPPCPPCLAPPQFVGYSQDSRLPAEFDVTAALRPGEENVLAVQVRGMRSVRGVRGAHPPPHSPTRARGLVVCSLIRCFAFTS